jgi:hypothetical protein
MTDLPEAIRQGWADAQRDDPERTVGYFRDLLGRHPADAHALFEYAGALDFADREAEAAPVYEQAFRDYVPGWPASPARCGECDRGRRVITGSAARISGSTSGRCASTPRTCPNDNNAGNFALAFPFPARWITLRALITPGPLDYTLPAELVPDRRSAGPL